MELHRFSLEGILIGDVFLREITLKKDYERFKKNYPEKIEEETQRIENLLGKKDSSKRITLYLLPETAESYFLENFMPNIWIKKAEQISGLEGGRNVYKTNMIKTDGTTEKIIIKRAKTQTLVYILSS